jgi:hypothetical protein
VLGLKITVDARGTQDQGFYVRHSEPPLRLQLGPISDERDPKTILAAESAH